MCLGMLTLALFEIEKNKRLDKWTIENERAGTSCFNKDKYQKQELNLKNQVREWFIFYDNIYLNFIYTYGL